MGYCQPYSQRVAELCGRLRFLATYSKTVIKIHPPDVAVSLIAEELDRVAPHLEALDLARENLLAGARQRLQAREGVDGA